jgi:hypothetical protein
MDEGRVVYEARPTPTMSHQKHGHGTFSTQCYW